MRIEVNENDIRYGVPFDSQGCAIARAFTRLGLDETQWICASTVDAGKTWDFITAFDHRGFAMPFEFDVVPLVPLIGSLGVTTEKKKEEVTV